MNKRQSIRAYPHSANKSEIIIAIDNSLDNSYRLNKYIIKCY